MKYLIFAVVAVVVLVLTTFGIQNPFPVTIRFLRWQTEAVPLYAVMLVSVLLGIALTSLLGLPARIQRGREMRRLRAELDRQATEISDLRARLPPPVMKPLPDER
jgi:uncharacterized integral membrane protein